MSSEPVALRLAAWAKQLALGNQIFGGPKDREEMGLIDAELRRLHAEREADRAAMREALEALINSVDYVQEDYRTNWRHGVPTRLAQLNGLKEQLEAHEAAIEKLKARTA